MDVLGTVRRSISVLRSVRAADVEQASAALLESRAALADADAMLRCPALPLEAQVDALLRCALRACGAWLSPPAPQHHMDAIEWFFFVCDSGTEGVVPPPPYPFRIAFMAVHGVLSAANSTDSGSGSDDGVAAAKYVSHLAGRMAQLPLLGSMVADAACSERAGAARWQPLAQALVALPDAAANATRGTSLPPALQPAVYYVRVCECVLRCLVDAASGGRDDALLRDSAQATVLLAELMERLCRRGCVTAAATAWLRIAGGADADGDDASASASTSTSAIAARFDAVFRILPVDAQERFLVECVQRCGGATLLRRVLGAASAQGLSAGVRQCLVRRVVMRRPWRRGAVRRVCDLLCGTATDHADDVCASEPRRCRHCSAPPPVFGGTAEQFLATLPADFVASVWSTQDFVGSVEQAVQASVTALLLECLHRAPQPLFVSHASRLLYAVMDGVQARLSSQNQYIRRHGMAVACAFSSRVSPETPLAFDEFDGSQALDEEPEVAPPARVSAARCVPAASGSPASAASPGSLVRGGDVDVDSDDDVEAGADGDVLRPFAMDDESEDSERDESDPVPPAGKPRKPTHIRAAMQALREQESVAHVVTVLSCLPSLVRSRLGDDSARRHEVTDSIAPLLNTLLAVDNRFDAPEFDALRMAALTAVLEAEPCVAVAALYEQFFSREQSDGVRMDILVCVAVVAGRLSGVRVDGGGATPSATAVVSKTAAAPPSPPSRAAAAAAAGDDIAAARAAAKAAAAARLEQRTRRWGTRRRGVPAATANRFAEPARWFFFPLLRGLEASDRGSEHDDSAPSSLFYVSKTPARAPFDPFRGGLNAPLVAETLRVLALLLECGYLSTDAPRMAQGLLDGLWRLRAADDASVRLSAVMAFASVVAAAARWHLHDDDDDSFGAAVVSGVVEGVRWLEDVRARDPDPRCRQVAATLCDNRALAAFASG
jgi:hypothetical protein